MNFFFEYQLQLKRAYEAKVEENKKLKKQLANSEQRVKELEEQVRKLFNK